MIVRMFRDIASYLYLATLYQKVNGYEPSHMISVFRDKNSDIQFESDAERNRAVNEANGLSNHGFQYTWTNQSIAEELVKQLDRTGSGINADGAAIDEVIHLLRLAYPRNRLDPGTISYLRRLLLSPEEISEVRTSLAQREIHCAACKRRLTSGEMVSLQIPSEGRASLDGVALYCVRCNTPEVMASSCVENHWQPLPKSLLNKVRKDMESPCPECATPQPEAAPAPPAVSTRRVGEAPVITERFTFRAKQEQERPISHRGLREALYRRAQRANSPIEFDRLMREIEDLDRRNRGTASPPPTPRPFRDPENNPFSSSAEGPLG